MNKLHSYLLGGMFLVAQLIAIAHLPTHILDSIQAPFDISGDGHTAQKLCGICLVADTLENGIVISGQLTFDFTPSQSPVSYATHEFKTPFFSLYSARAPPAFS